MNGTVMLFPPTIAALSAMAVLICAGGLAACMLGLVRAQSAATQGLLALSGMAVALVTFCAIGYGLMFVGVEPPGLWGSFSLFHDVGHAQPHWLFHAGLAVLAATIVSGAVAERVRPWPYLLFTAILTGVLFPVQASWSWGGGWLNGISGGFRDLSGATVVHVCAGCAALTGTMVLGPRTGRYGPGGQPIPFMGSNVPLAVLGVWLAWFGWFGMAAGAANFRGLYIDGLSVALLNTALGGAAACLATTLYAAMRWGKPDLTVILNGCVAGLVALSGAPDLYTPMEALGIGAVAGVLAVVTIAMLDRYRIDDPAGVIAAHLAAGAWGTIAVALFGTGDFLAQFAGLAAIAAFSALTSAIVWRFIAATTGLRCSARAERHSLDVEELGHNAYPDFAMRSVGRPDAATVI